MRCAGQTRSSGAGVRRGQTQAVLLVFAVLLATAGCDRKDKPPPSTQPAPGTSEEQPPLTLLAPESAAWSRAAAAERLADPKLGVSAAVRLARLADATPLCAPEQLTDATASRLRLVPLSERLWALGLADRRNPRALHAPVLIDAEGNVVTTADGTEEEALTLHISKDADVVPHLLVTPLRVFLAEVPPRLALTLAEPQTIGFAWRPRGDYGYVGLLLHGDGGWTELAQYRWEPYELGFCGPASDKLPDPPGGKFVLDMEKSPLLIPEGGEMPERQPNKEPPPVRTPARDEV
jgi:hypothetical protein